MLKCFRSPEQELAKVSSDRLPTALVLAAVLPICAGFAIVRPVTDPSNIQASNLFEAGLAAQQRGENVTAAEDYAIVLGLEPSNKFARYQLGTLQQNAGRTSEALALYMSALRDDPSFTAASQRIATLQARAIK